jgi:hypothetical protein
MLSLLAALLLASGIAHATPPVLEPPIRCTLGKDCFIQNYVDRDPGPGFRDYRCGPLGYDGHKGTDFRVSNLAAMQAGVPVVAAAAGMVVGVRDGEPDVALRERTEALRPERMAGNVVWVDHGDGWVTQYSHLKQGSVRVQRGQRVAAGAVLGLVGLSGNTEFPHVDFAVSHNGKVVDPFSSNSADRCGEPQGGLWSSGAAPQVRYQPTGLLGAGFAPIAPTHEWAKSGAKSTVDRDSAALCFWHEIFGLRQGDRLLMELRGPTGEVLVRHENQAEKNRAVSFAFVGKKRRDYPWPAGRYVGHVKLQRDGTTVLDETRTLTIE